MVVFVNTLRCRRCALATRFVMPRPRSPPLSSSYRRFASLLRGRLMAAAATSDEDDEMMMMMMTMTRSIAPLKIHAFEMFLSFPRSVPFSAHTASAPAIHIRHYPRNYSARVRISFNVLCIVLTQNITGDNQSIYAKNVLCIF